MDEKDWFDPWPLMNFSPVSFWIHSNVMVSLFIAFLSFAPSLLVTIPLLPVLPLGLPKFAAIATVFFSVCPIGLPRFACYPRCSTRVFDRRTYRRYPLSSSSRFPMPVFFSSPFLFILPPLCLPFFCFFFF